MLVAAGLLECGAAVVIADISVGPGLEQLLKSNGLAEINRGGIHEGCVAEIVRGVDRYTSFDKDGDYCRPIDDRYPMEQIDAGAFSETGVGSRQDQGSNNVRIAEGYRVGKGTVGSRVGAVGQKQFDIFQIVIEAKTSGDFRTRISEGACTSAPASSRD